ARKTDKAVSRRARDRAAALRIGAGDIDAIATKAQSLCLRAEAQLRAGNTDEATSQQIEQEWSRLGAGVPPDILARFQGALAVLHQMQFSERNPAPVPEVAEASTGDSISDPISAAPASAAPTDLVASQARFDAALSAAAGEAQAERERRRSTLQSIEKLAGEYAARLDAGDFSAARLCNQSLAVLLVAAGALPVALDSRVSALQARYEELLRWQQWASRNRRQDICANIETLAASEVHPDALATRVREAREEWRRLDASENAESADSALARRFNALCHRALKPTKAYFEKRDELRRTRTVEIEALVSSAEPTEDAVRNWRATMGLRTELSTALRSLDDVEQKARTALARRIKEAIARLSAALSARELELEAAKHKLIARATALQGCDEKSAARQARELQQEWTALGTGRRSTDQRQWQEFRKACDAVFAGLDTAKKQRETQSLEAQAQERSIVEAIEALRDQGELTPAQRKSALRELQARWQACAVHDRSLMQRHARLVEGIEESMRGAARLQRLSRFDRALRRYALLRSAEQGGQEDPAFAALWSETEGPHDAMSAALDRRRLAAASTEMSAEAAARGLLVELEFVAGIETPLEDHARRMNFQVQRLASRMRDRVSTQPDVEVADALARWFGQTAQNEALEQRFLRAANAAVASLP
ncbi:MAG: DUF349 domain-containing protein, partial [Rudaea sp.]